MLRTLFAVSSKMADNGAVGTGEPQTEVPVTEDSKLVTKDETHTTAATKDSGVKCQPVRSHWH